jgi:hypothetical protein
LIEVKVKPERFNAGFVDFLVKQMNEAPGTVEPNVRASFKNWRYFFWLLALFLFGFLFYVEENWRGKRALDKYKMEQQARGKSIEPSAFIPPRVADSQNFAMTPFLAPLFDFQPGTQKLRDPNALSRAQDFVALYNSAKGKVREKMLTRSNSWVNTKVDLIQWHDALLRAEMELRTADSRARVSTATGFPSVQTNTPDMQISTEAAVKAVLEKLSDYNPVIEQLRSDSSRPFSRFNVHYEEQNPAGILLPHLSSLQRLTEILQLRAFAQLVSGRTEEAFADVKLMLYLSNATRDEPILMSQLVRLSQMHLVLEVISVGMHQWSESQLRYIQQRLDEFDFCADISRTIDSEKVLLGGGMIDFIRRFPKEYAVLTSNGDALRSAVFAVMPSGWFDFEKVNYYRVTDSFLNSNAISASKARINPTAVKQAQRQIESTLDNSPRALLLSHRFFAQSLMPTLESLIRKTAFAQQGIELAEIACALERYRRANGVLAESPDKLIPQYAEKMPLDIITGQPLRYKLLEDHQYLIYSIGWNEVDDGGVIAGGKKERSVPAVDGDWVWRQ